MLKSPIMTVKTIPRPRPPRQHQLFRALHANLLFSLRVTLFELVISCPLSVKFRFYGPYPVTSGTFFILVVFAYQFMLPCVRFPQVILFYSSIQKPHWQLRNYGETLNRSENLLLVCVVYNDLLTPISDHERISPYNIKTISSRKVMRIKKNISWGIIR